MNLLVTLTMAAVAAFTYQDDLGKLTLLKAPCPSVVKALLPPATHERMSEAQYQDMKSGAYMQACYTYVEADGEGYVYIHYADNDFSVIPVKKFSPVQTISR